MAFLKVLNIFSLTGTIKCNSSKMSITLHPNAKQKGKGANTTCPPPLPPGAEEL